MNVPTVQQSPTTPTTSSTATAPTASSGTVQRIDDFIKAKFREADSASGSGISDSADRAARLGFVNCANTRYSEFLEAFRDSSHLTKTYQERYPNSLFLPWRALHAVLKTLDLWVDLPEHYMGAVPSEQLPWMEIFELEDMDRIQPREAGLLLGDSTASALVEGVLAASDDPAGFEAAFATRSLSNAGRAVALQKNSFFNGMIRQRWSEARDSFFVVAPRDAFRSTKDWLERFRALLQDAATEPTVAPPDPLVIRFCYGGCLVVAAWGDEAAALNEITQELNL